MTDQPGIIIIGGGVIGLACAHYLIEKNARVTIIEKDRVGDGASHGNCGLLYFSDVTPLCVPGAVSHEIIRTLKGTSPLYIKPTLSPGRISWLLRFAGNCTHGHKRQAAKGKFELLSYCDRLYGDLLKSEDLPCDYEAKGVLTVFKDPENFNGFAETDQFQQAFGIKSQKIEKQDLLEMEPSLGNHVAGAWHTLVDAHLRPDLLMASWKNSLKEKGVVFKENCRFLKFNLSCGKVNSIDTQKGRFNADAFVMAAGAWTPFTMKQLNLRLPVEPGKGYSITMKPARDCPVFPLYFYESNVVATPWKSACRLGGTMEFSGFDLSLNRARLNKIISGAGQYLKHPIESPVIEEWTSLRPMTCDDMPIIDRVPRLDNLIMATGHGMLGLTLATGTGKAVSDLVYGNKPEIDLSPFSLARFR